jgi:hypothetical protein
MAFYKKGVPGSGTVVSHVFNGSFPIRGVRGNPACHYSFPEPMGWFDGLDFVEFNMKNGYTFR